MHDRLRRERRETGIIGNGGLLGMYLWMELILFNLGGEVALHITLELNHAFAVVHGVMVPALTSNAGTLTCVAGKACWFAYLHIYKLKASSLRLFSSFFSSLKWYIYKTSFFFNLKHVCTREYVVGRKLQYEGL